MRRKPIQPLSEQGRMRREHMLCELVEAMSDHHRRRRHRHRVAAVCVLGVCAGGLAVWRLATVSHAPAATITEVASRLMDDSSNISATCEVNDECAATATTMLVSRVETDSSVLDRYRAHATHQVEIVDDAELLQTLRSFNRPTGLVRMAGEAFLTASVADPFRPAHDLPNSL